MPFDFKQKMNEAFMTPSQLSMLQSREDAMAKAEMLKAQTLEAQARAKEAQFGADNSLGFTTESFPKNFPMAPRGQGLVQQGPTALDKGLGGLPDSNPTPRQSIPNAEGMRLAEKQRDTDNAAALARMQAKQTQQGFGNSNTLRDEFNNNSKNFMTVVPMYKNIVAAATNPNPTAASDMSLIFAYMKLLDPNSTVREGEYATAQNAGSAWQKAGNLYNSILQGQKLQPEQRMNFAREAQGVYKSAASTQGQHISRYTDLAKRNGIDPANVIYDYGNGLGSENFGGQQGGFDPKSLAEQIKARRARVGNAPR